MHLSQKSRETIDACRFCWMCRHICPIGNATGQERNTSRARALGLSLVLRDAETLPNVIDNVYECALCGACTKECLTGWDPVAFTLEVRLEGALTGILPEKIVRLVGNIEKSGNVYGAVEIDSALKQEIESLPKDSETILFLGKDAVYKNPQGAVDAIRLLKKAGVDFTVLLDEPDSGYALYYLVGAAEETRKLLGETAEKLNGYKTVIAYDPNDAKMFLRQYKEWNIALKPEVKTWTSLLAALVGNGKIKPKKTKETYTFQDPFALARDLEETEPARAVLSACGAVAEMLLHGKDTMLAGNLIMKEYMPVEMEWVARERWNDAINVGTEILVTASPSEYVCLKENRPEGLRLLSIEEVILKCS